MTAVCAVLAALAWLCWRGTAVRAAARRRILPTGVRGALPRQRMNPVHVSARLATARRAEVIELTSAVAAELAAGAGWDESVRRAARLATGADGLTPLATAVDPQTTLLRLGDQPGRQSLRVLAAVGALSARTGAPAAALVDELGSALRADARARRTVEVELAPAVATARLLAGLPVLGLLMGSALGAKPLAVLLGTAGGHGVLAAALGLEWAGLSWCRRIRRRALG